jgi:hypothetical protein
MKSLHPAVPFSSTPVQIGLMIFLAPSFAEWHAQHTEAVILKYH